LLRTSIMAMLGVVTIGLLPATAAADVFTDDFNRPDGVLESPWTVLDQQLLYIESAHVVANASEFGLMAYFPACLSNELSLEADFSFGGDTDGGRFQFFIGAGSSDEDARGFVAIIETDRFFIRWFSPEQDLVFGSFAFSPLTTYKMRLHYSTDTQVVTLTIMDENANVIDEIEATRGTEALQLCAIGLENSAQARKWADDVRFEYACDVVGVPEVVTTPVAVHVAPNPFNPRTTISFAIPVAQPVVVSVFDASGRHIATLADRTFGAGTHGLTWDGRDDLGHEVGSGTYVAGVMTAEGLKTHKLTLLR